MNSNIKNDMFEHFSQSPVYELDDIIDPRVKVEIIYSIFYVLIGMKAILDRPEFNFYHSVEVLRKDIEDYLNYISGIFSKMLYEYTVIAVFGELRYVSFRTSIATTKINNKLIQETSDTSYYNSGDRNRYRAYLEFVDRFSPKSIYQAGIVLFKNLHWEKEYGGDNWARIADIINKYEHLPAQVFIDYCADIEHNSGCYLNKSCGLFYPGISIKHILNAKRILCLSDVIKEVRSNLDTKTFKLYERFVGIMGFLLGNNVPNLPDTFLSKNGFHNFENYTYVLNLLKKRQDSIMYNNLEVFKLSLYKPKEFGTEDLRQYYTVTFSSFRYRRIYEYYQDERYFEEDKLPCPDTLVDVDELPLSQVKFLEAPDWYGNTIVQPIY